LPDNRAKRSQKENSSFALIKLLEDAKVAKVSLLAHPPLTNRWP